MKDQVNIKQLYLTQVKSKRNDLENVPIYLQRMLIFFHCHCSYLLRCGDIQENPVPFDASKFFYF